MKFIVSFFLGISLVKAAGSNIDSKIQLNVIQRDEVSVELYDLIWIDPIEELTTRVNIDDEVFETLEEIVKSLANHLPPRQNGEPDIYLIPGYGLGSEPSQIVFYESGSSKLIIDIPQEWILGKMERRILTTVLYHLKNILAYQENQTLLNPEQISIQNQVSRSESDAIIQRIKENFKCSSFFGPENM